MNSQQFYNLTNQAIANDIQVYNNESAAAGFDTSRYGPLSVLQSVGIVDGNGNPVPNPVAPYYNLASGVNTNWEDAIFRTAPITNVELQQEEAMRKQNFLWVAGFLTRQALLSTTITEDIMYG